MNKESKQIMVVWVRSHKRLPYSKGYTGYVSFDAAKVLLKYNYVELLNNDDADLFQEESADSELNIESVFLSGHPDFAYHAGDITSLSEANAKRLFSENFIDLFSEDPDTRNSILKRLGPTLGKK